MPGRGLPKAAQSSRWSIVDGILLTADNPSASLHKVSEIYDNIAFAGAGKYSEFENLRKAGIRHADLRGFMYSREDVTGRSLANGYSQSLGTVFSQEMKPLEVEILVVQAGTNHHPNEIYRISFDGSIIDEKNFAVIGGRSEAVAHSVERKRPRRCSALGCGTEAVCHGAGADGQSKTAAGRIGSRGLGPNPYRPKVSPIIDRRRSTPPLSLTSAFRRGFLC